MKLYVLTTAARQPFPVHPEFRLTALRPAFSSSLPLSTIQKIPCQENVFKGGPAETQLVAKNALASQRKKTGSMARRRL